MINIKEEIKRRFAGKKIGILGMGREGVSTYKFIRAYFPDAELILMDRLPINELSDKAKEIVRIDKKVLFVSGDGYLDGLKKCDLVFRTPGISPELISGKFPGLEITSQTKLFLELCRDRVVGVTGTKGKSTTSGLIYAILKQKCNNVHLIGNIGYPPLQFLRLDSPETLFIFELSSHQLADIDVSPRVAVILNIYPEHLDYYPNIDDYIKAKSKIALLGRKGDLLIFNMDSEPVNNIAELAKAQKLGFSEKNKPGSVAYVDGNWLCYKNEKYIQKILEITEIPLLGKHNLVNCLAAIIATQNLGVSVEDIKKGINNFKSLPCRLELVGRYKGIDFINDSLATVPQAAVAAIEAFGARAKTLIVGGFDRGLDYRVLAKAIIKSSIETVILLPDTGDKIRKEIEMMTNLSNKLPEMIEAESIKEAVEQAFKHTKPGRMVLLSPAAASFNMFKNYSERGAEFTKWVKILGQ